MFNRALQGAMEEAVKQFAPASILIVDVDHFKKINDTYGHPAGDAVLRALARRMEGALRTVDKVARLGGEDFQAPRGIPDFAERMRRLAKHMKPPKRLAQELADGPLGGLSNLGCNWACTAPRKAQRAL